MNRPTDYLDISRHRVPGTPHVAAQDKHIQQHPGKLTSLSLKPNASMHTDIQAFNGMRLLQVYTNVKRN